jgi:anti-sigma B factor antagonist
MSKALQEMINTQVPESPDFSVTTEPMGQDGAIVAVTGELDMLTVPALRNELDSVVEGGIRRIVIDLSAVSFIDSVSLAAIVTTRRRLGEGGRVGVVIEEGSYAMLIFEIGGLDSVVELFPTRERAVSRLGA